jgi:hypothetical protein
MYIFVHVWLLDAQTGHTQNAGGGTTYDRNTKIYVSFVIHINNWGTTYDVI